MYVLSQDLFNKTYYPKLEDHQQINKPWYIVDAEVRLLPPAPNPVCPQNRKRDVRGEPAAPLPATTTTHGGSGRGRRGKAWVGVLC